MTDTLSINAQPIPLQIDSLGVVRVSGTRVSLDTVIAAFQEGESAEEIAQDYPSLSLADVYAVIAYYLNHQAEVEKYLVQSREKAKQVRESVEARYDPIGIRQRLLARKKAMTE